MLRAYCAIFLLCLSSPTLAYKAQVSSLGPMTPEQRTVAEKLTSIWENDSTELQYGYSENIKDDRGYTSGRAGFCTGTGDAILVVRCFDKLSGSLNKLHKYMPELERLEARFEESGDLIGDTRGLDRIGKFPKDWEASDKNPELQEAFRACQDFIVDELYYLPAMKAAEAYGLKTALSKAVFYDSFINHGADGAKQIADYAEKKAGEAPATGHTLETESKWLSAFLKRRFDILSDDEVWGESVGRVVNYQQLQKDGNWELDKSFSTLKTSSGYTVYHIDPG